MHCMKIALDPFNSKNVGGAIVALKHLSRHGIWEPNLYKIGTHFGIFGAITSCDGACIIRLALHKFGLLIYRGIQSSHSIKASSVAF